MKKISMFTNGTGTINEDGQIRKASKEEIQNYLVSLAPATKGGSKLEAIKFEKGALFARYANGKVFKKQVVAQATQSENQNEPVNSGDKADPDVKVPRNESKAKPQEFDGRDDVNSPDKIRKDNYERGGKGGADLHENIPRSSGNSGLEGSKKTDFEDEHGDDATSGNPDSYVQKFTDSEKPAPAGSESNRAAESNVTLRPESEIYQKVKVAAAEDEDDKEEKSEEKDEKSKSDKMPPWLKNKGDDKKDEKDSKETEDKEASLKVNLKKAQDELNKLKAENNRYRVRESRQNAAVKLALAYRDISPDKYADAESFCNKVESIAKKMTVEAAETAYAELVCLANDARDQKKVAKKDSGESIGDGNLSTVLASSKEERFEKEANTVDKLKEMLMSHSRIGKQLSEFENNN